MAAFFNHPLMIVVGPICTIVSMIALLCSKQARMTVPVNYVLLFIFTFGETAVIADLTSKMEVFSVILSIAALALVVGVLFISALFTKLSANLFRNLAIGIMLAVVAQLILCLMMMIGGLNQGLMLLYGSAGVLVVGFYILIDLVQIMTPDAISYDDYILGAMMLYIDIVRMFLYILIILGKKK